MIVINPWKYAVEITINIVREKYRYLSPKFQEYINRWWGLRAIEDQEIGYNQRQREKRRVADRLCKNILKEGKS